MEGAGGDGAVCYGTAPFTICLASAPTEPYISDTVPLDTDASPPCMLAASGGADYYVIAATTITVHTMVRATGRRPLVLIASESIQIDEGAGIDVGSHRTQGDEASPGAGADFGGCGSGTQPPGVDQGGGGAGGSFSGGGGPGGIGAGAGSGPGGIAGTTVTNVTTIRGGCAGQDGGGSPPGLKGHGGGAVFLIARDVIRVAGAILAGGEGGGGGVRTDVAGGMHHDSGGGGGGAGGMIGLDAPSVSVTGLLVANGGGGGEGAGTPPEPPASGNGGDGVDATTVDSACGGNAGTMNAGAGGCGSPGCMTPETCTPVGPGTAAAPGDIGADGGASSGGGGGGGGAGLIKVLHAASLGGQVSPPPTP